jgi:hypothetical protein
VVQTEGTSEPELATPPSVPHATVVQTEETEEEEKKLK